MPLVALATSGDDKILQINPSLADKVCAFIVVEYGELESEVIGGFVHGEAEFLVPGQN
jgi:hypothetical protein